MSILANINDAMGMHQVASEHGHEVNHMLEVVHWFMIILGVGWTIFMAVVLLKFHQKKHPKASYYGVTSHYSTHVEVWVVIVEVVLLLGFAFPLWAKRVDKFPDSPEVVKIRAVGEQFRWTFHYAGADGLMGLADYRELSGQNGIGLVDEPNAQDDFITANDLVLPKDRQVVIQVSSKDVIHGLALVPFMIQQDAIPGQEIPMWFVPNQTGEWDIVCAQLCGAGHAKMVATVRVLEGEEYDQWAAGQRPLLPSLK